jgi:hypothetical protein
VTAPTAPIPERRAQRLLRIYPSAWRERYGDEFEELLVADICERPRSLRRTADVIRGGLVARLARLGLCGFELEPSERVRASLAALGCCMAAFLVFATTMWSQLTIGWQWAAPSTFATATATVVMSLAMYALLALAALAAVPVLAALASSLARRAGGRLAAPASVATTCAIVLAAGGRHFANGWPGTGGHPWAHQGLVPGGLAAFSWASTLSVSSYWAHPSALARFPAAELAWMVVSPIAVVTFVAAVAKIVRRLELPAAVLRFEARLAAAAIVVMALFFTASCLWVVDGGPGPRNLFHAGAIDITGIVVVAFALTVAHRQLRRARLGTAVLTTD